MPGQKNSGEIRSHGDGFEVWEDGRKVGEARNEGDHYDVYKWGRKVSELHPRGEHFDVHAGTTWGKTGEVRRNGRDYDVYDGPNRTQQFTPSRGMHSDYYDVRDVPRDGGDAADDLIQHTANGIGAALGSLIGNVVNEAFSSKQKAEEPETHIDADGFKHWNF